MLKLKTLKRLPNPLRFLFIILLGLGVLAFFDSSLVLDIFLKASQFMKKLLPSLVLVFLFMYVFNLLVTNKLIKKYFQEKVGVKQFLIVGLAGVLSSGPVYMWFNFLEKLEKEGFNKGLISIFLYTRAIKLPLLPLMISFFSLKTTIIISSLILVFSVINALLINLFFKPVKS